MEVGASANTVSLERKKPSEPAPPPADTIYPEPQRGVEGRIRRLAVQNCDGFCDPTRTLYPKAPANFEASRSESDLPPSLLFSARLAPFTSGGRPICRKTIVPRLTTDPQTAPPLQEGTQSFVEVDAAAYTVSLDRKKPRESAPPPTGTFY